MQAIAERVCTYVVSTYGRISNAMVMCVLAHVLICMCCVCTVLYVVISTMLWGVGSGYSHTYSQLEQSHK